MTDASCASCGSALPDGFRFCPACGSGAHLPCEVDEQRRLLTEALARYRQKEHLMFVARGERELG